MAKGSLAKSEIYKKIMEVFPGSFMYNDGKELRINAEEDGGSVQIKLVLTATKVAVSNGEDNAIPGAAVAVNEEITETKETKAPPAQVTEDERQAVVTLMEKLGL